MNARDIVERLHLTPHPEGGWYRETFRDPHPAGGRARSTAIYFLLEEGQVSHWHRVDAPEIWLFHAGAPLTLEIAEPGRDRCLTILGADLADGQQPQAVVPTGAWQAARPLGSWTLVSCVVAPGFEFSGFELAPGAWTPGPG